MSRFSDMLKPKGHMITIYPAGNFAHYECTCGLASDKAHKDVIGLYAEQHLREACIKWVGR